MARDYSNRRNNRSGKSRSGKSGKRSNGKRKAAPATKQRRSAPKKNTRKKTGGTPKWVWLGCVLFLAIAVAAVAYIATRPTSHPGRDLSTTTVPQPETTASSKPAATSAPKQQSQQTQFAFYEMLPDYEVVIPGEMDDIKRRSQQQASGASTASKQSNTASTTSTDKAGHYIIQVGAFSNGKDANRLKAKVTLLGLQAKVVESENDSGQAIYRVRSGVIDSDNRLAELLKRLHDSNIDTLVLRRKD